MFVICDENTVYNLNKYFKFELCKDKILFWYNLDFNTNEEGCCDEEMFENKELAEYAYNTIINEIAGGCETADITYESLKLRMTKYKGK